MTGVAAPGIPQDLQELLQPEPARLRSATAVARRWLLPWLVLFGGWEAVSHFAGLNPQLFPPLEVVLPTCWQLLRNGVLLSSAAATLGRLLLGWAAASAVGLTAGFAMARSRFVQDLLLPLISILMPIPSLALVPLFILWFGLSETSVIVLVFFTAVLPMTLNTWMGMTSVRPVLMRAAQSMDVTGYRLFRKVVLPGSLPFVMTGLRIGLANGWKAVVAGEMIAASQSGLGVLIFNSREFLRTDVMLSTLLVIGPLGFLLERVLFQSVERATIARWGMTSNA